MTEHANWFRGLVGTDTEKAAAARAKITTSTLNRQLAKGSLTESIVIALARGYGQNPVEALVRTGYLTREEALGSDLSASLLSDQELIHELALRVNADESVWQGTFSDAVDESKVRELPHSRSVSPHDALIDDINAGIEPIAAQEATEPLEQHWT